MSAFASSSNDPTSQSYTTEEKMVTKNCNPSTSTMSSVFLPVSLNDSDVYLSSSINQRAQRQGFYRIPADNLVSKGSELSWSASLNSFPRLITPRQLIVPQKRICLRSDGRLKDPPKDFSKTISTQCSLTDVETNTSQASSERSNTESKSTEASSEKDLLSENVEEPTSFLVKKSESARDTATYFKDKVQFYSQRSLSLKGKVDCGVHKPRTDFIKHSSGDTGDFSRGTSSKTHSVNLGLDIPSSIVDTSESTVEPNIKIIGSPKKVFKKRRRKQSIKFEDVVKKQNPLNHYYRTPDITSNSTPTYIVSPVISDAKNDPYNIAGLKEGRRMRLSSDTSSDMKSLLVDNETDDEEEVRFEDLNNEGFQASSSLKAGEKGLWNDEINDEEGLSDRDGMSNHDLINVQEGIHNQRFMFNQGRMHKQSAHQQEETHYQDRTHRQKGTNYQEETHHQEETHYKKGMNIENIMAKQNRHKSGKGIFSRKGKKNLRVLDTQKESDSQKEKDSLTDTDNHTKINYQKLINSQIGMNNQQGIDSSEEIKSETEMNSQIGINSLTGINNQTGINSQTGMNSQTELNIQTGMSSKKGINKQKEMKNQKEINSQKEVDSQKGMNSLKEVDSQKGMNSRKELDSQKGMNSQNAKNHQKALNNQKATNNEKPINYQKITKGQKSNNVKGIYTQNNSVSNENNILNTQINFEDNEIQLDETNNSHSDSINMMASKLIAGEFKDYLIQCNSIQNPVDSPELDAKQKDMIHCIDSFKEVGSALKLSRMKQVRRPSRQAQEMTANLMKQPMKERLGERAREQNKLLTQRKPQHVDLLYYNLSTTSEEEDIDEFLNENRESPSPQPLPAKQKSGVWRIFCCGRLCRKKEPVPLT